METRTYRPNVDFDIIANELSYRVGRPDLRNEDHLGILVEILKEAGWNSSAITYFIRNIIIIAEATPPPKQPSGKKVKVYVSKGETPPKGVKLKLGPDGGRYYMGYPKNKAQANNKTQLNKNVKVAPNKTKAKVQAQPKQNSVPVVPNQTNPDAIKKTKQPIVKPEVKHDKDGKYVPSDQDKQMILDKAQIVTTQSKFLVKKAAVELMANFDKDVQRLIDTRDPKLATDMVAKYGLERKVDAEVGNKSKLYINKLKGVEGKDSKVKAYKYFCDDKGNLESSILAQILIDTGALKNVGGYGKKAMTPNKIITEKTQFAVKEIPGGMQVGDHKVLRNDKPYNWKKVARAWKKQYGWSNEEINKRIKIGKKAQPRHNYMVEQMKDAVFGGQDSVYILKVSDADITTPEGKRAHQDAMIDATLIKMKELARNKLTPGVKNIMDGFSSLKNITNTNDYATRLGEIMFQFAKDPTVKQTAPDIAEVIEYLALLNEGKMAFIPGDANFAFGDIFTMSFKVPTLQDLIDNPDNLATIFIGTEDVSVKTGQGGASGPKPKILLTHYDQPEVQGHLLAILDNYKDLMIKGNTDGADKLIAKLEKIYAKDLNNDIYKKRLANIPDWVKRNASKKPCSPERWKRYLRLGAILDTVNNQHIDFQSLKNSKYVIGKTGVHRDTTNGVNKMATMKFDPSSKSNTTCTPNQPYATRVVNQ